MLVGGAAIGKEMATILRITFGSIQASRAELTYFLKDPYFDPSMGLSLREQFGGDKGYDDEICKNTYFRSLKVESSLISRHKLLIM